MFIFHKSKSRPKNNLLNHFKFRVWTSCESLWIIIAPMFLYPFCRLMTTWATSSVGWEWAGKIRWAATWQNQQSDCASSEDSDQPGHPPSLIRVFAVRMKKVWVLSYPLSAQRRLLIRLGGCPLILLALSCRGSVTNRHVLPNHPRQSPLWEECSCAVPMISKYLSKFVPPHDKTNKMPSLIRVFACAQWVAKDQGFLHAVSEDSDQTGRMPRLIWVFAGCTCHFVGFVMRWLIYTTSRSR